jgi:hypothetical protein
MAQIQHYDTGALEQQYQDARTKYLNFAGVDAAKFLAGEPIPAAQGGGDPKTTAAQSDATTAALNKITGYTPPPPTTPSADQNKPIDLWNPAKPAPLQPGPAMVPGQGTFDTTTEQAVGTGVTAPQLQQEGQQSDEQRNQQNVLNLF